MSPPKDSSKADDGEPASQPAQDQMANSKMSEAVETPDLPADLAAPYGTRSRNRTGTSRPNYAEDKDIDNDMFEFYHSDKKATEGKKSSRQNGVSTSSEGHRINITLRKSGGEEGKNAPGQNGAKDQTTTATTNTTTTNATTTSSSNTNNSSSSSASHSTDTNSTNHQPSKKRKAATQQQSQSNGSGNSSITGAKKTPHLPQGSATPARTWPESNMLTFENCKARPEKGRLVADDGTVLQSNDHVYLVCEPPGEPYYLGRIMEFLHAKKDSKRSVDAVRINWFYRPKDIGRKANDTRQVYATMHSDISPLTALRGKCQIRHRSEIKDMDSYLRSPDSFWFDKLYDRYIQKNYELIPTSSIVNVPDKVKKVLDERWKFVLVEQGRGKELTSAVKLCKRCSGYCASNDSVDCAVCQNTYHMNCVRPPLLKKPSRGFAWSCAACSRAQERKLEAQLAPHLGTLADADEDEVLDEEEDDLHTNRTTPDDEEHKHHQGTAEQIYQASLWPWRYLGMHCKPEDALDYDDRIYPRASTRIGPRHQAAVLPWPGRPVEYEKPVEIKKVGKKDSKAFKEAQALMEAEKVRREQRPKWLQDEPADYHVRGLDDGDEDHKDHESTSVRLWVPPSGSSTEENTSAFMQDARETLTKRLNLTPKSTNAQDVALQTYCSAEYNANVALGVLESTHRNQIGDPKLSAEEEKRFVEAISKYGSELSLVTRHVKTMHYGDVVRYYYTWKKTKKGEEVWNNFTGRKGKKEAKRAEAAANKMADDVADNEDDSAFDLGKAVAKKRTFMCQFCNKTEDRQWRRAPNSAPISEAAAKNNAKEKNSQHVGALCRRCAELWRRYAIVYEPLDEVLKKIAAAGGRGWRRKQDDELLRELQAAQDWGLMTPERAGTPSDPATAAASAASGQEPPRKKLKSEKDPDTGTPDAAAAKKKEEEKKREKEKATPPIPEMPKPRILPCGVCGLLDPQGDKHVSCRECRLTVHRTCYGITDCRPNAKWICDMCLNDKNPQLSVHYKCVLCPIDFTEQDLIERPAASQSKKKMSDKEREREKLEAQQARKAAEQYRKKQEELGRPTMPREALKRTADNNWVHVTCAVWTSEVKFGNSKALEPCEGIPSLPGARFEAECQVCNGMGGAVVHCQNHMCRRAYHVECARQAGHILGFDVTPVKSSRRDQFNVVTVSGETGAMSANIWCKDHLPSKTIVHSMAEIANEAGQTTLQVYAQNFKQADLALTGTVRKANLMNPLNASSNKASIAPAQAAARRLSTTTITNGTSAASQHRNGEVAHEVKSEDQHSGDHVCVTCGIDVTPKWWPVEQDLVNGHGHILGTEARKFLEQRKFQCHKCHKLGRTPRPYPAPQNAPASANGDQSATLDRPAGYETAKDAAGHPVLRRSPDVRNGHLVSFPNQSPRMLNGVPPAPTPSSRDAVMDVRRGGPVAVNPPYGFAVPTGQQPPEGAWQQGAPYGSGPPASPRGHARTGSGPPGPGPHSQGHYGPPPPSGPPSTSLSAWPHQPSGVSYRWDHPTSHHGSPPPMPPVPPSASAHHYGISRLNGPPPPPPPPPTLQPPSSLGGLRGPAATYGPPPDHHRPGIHTNGHGVPASVPPPPPPPPPPAAVNGVSPHLQHRVSGGPAPLPAYAGPYEGPPPGHGPPPPPLRSPRAASMHGFHAGPGPASRPDTYPSPGSVHRSPYSVSRGSPPERRNVLPPPHGGLAGSSSSTQAPARTPERRPSSGASNNPSLRNLLSWSG